MHDMKAVVLLSGGIDSATTCAVARDAGYDVYALSFFYNQRHHMEIRAARRLADSFQVSRHIIINLPSLIFSSSALIKGSPEEIPQKEISDPSDIPVTYVPGRNILFLSYALSYAENIAARDIFIGANCVDYSGYPDCRPAFIEAFEQMANLGTKSGVTGNRIRIRAPLIMMKKSEIITLGTELGVDYGMTLSCYNPSGEGLSCGRCDSCVIRKAGFAEAGIPDPTRYRAE